MRGDFRLVAVFVIGLAVLAGGCSAPTRNATAPTVTPAVATAPAAVATAAGAAAPDQGLRTFAVVPGESEVSYAVEEQFLGVNTPTQAIGRTSNLSGTITIELAEGRPVLFGGEIVAHLFSLASDDADRDKSLQQRWLESARFPEARFRIQQVEGLPATLTPGQLFPFTLVGELTVRNRTVVTRWQTEAQLDGDTLRGTATTTLRLSDFGIPTPEVLGVLRAEDEVRLTIQVAARDADAAVVQAQPAASPTVVAVQGTPGASTGSVLTAESDVQPVPPDYRERFVHYTTVSRPDGTFRRMFINPEALAAVAAGQPLPSGTMIIMETYAGDQLGGTLFNREKRDGWEQDALSSVGAAVRNDNWRYPSFSAADLSLRSQDGTSCHSCHARAEASDYVFTMANLREAARTGQTQASSCGLSGRQPCGP